MRGQIMLFGLGVLFFVFGVTSANAASLYIDPHETSLYRADTVTVAVRLDTDEGECVNTVDAVISYDGGSLQAVDVTRGRSILSLWVEAPVIDKEAKTISFAGGVPNGYCGRIPGDPSLTNIVAELVFRAPGLTVGRASGNTTNIVFGPETRVLLNDGLGTEAPLRLVDGTIMLQDGVGPSVSDSWGERVSLDTRPPEPFTVELVQNGSVFSGKYYIVFSTTDKQSGIDHYEVIEESEEETSLFRWGAADAPWREVTSPYVLTDQTLGSVIRVKAVDKAGNEYIAVLVPDESLRRELILLEYGLYGGLLVIALLILGGVVFFMRRRVKGNRSEETKKKTNNRTGLEKPEDTPPEDTEGTTL